MPRRFKKRTYKKKSKTYRRRKTGRRTTMVRTKGVLPDMMQMRLTYTQQGTLSSGIASYVENTFRGNSIFDPDLTGVGTQPLGRDEWSNFYTYYRVYASKCRVYFDTEDSADGVIASVIPSIDSNQFSNFNVAMQTPYARYRNMGVSAGTNAKVVSNYMETSKMFGVRAINYETDFSANFTTNPAREWFWHVGVGCSDGLSNPNANYTIKIVYYVEFFGRKQLAAS